ncbi:hypothetical protein AB0J55_00285 [Amycolatopsis sp. NPDC049688]|uniref:hypothetical protein n=1 Tax=Amycolatopsis sp. NPDC049688 TaxID=3154733 RepID=UPI0034176CDC
MVDPEDTIYLDADVVRIPRPRSLLRMLLNLFRLRSERLKASDRGDTIIEVAQVLSGSGHGGRVSSHGPDGDRWTVSVPTAPTASPAPTAEAR